MPSLRECDNDNDSSNGNVYYWLTDWNFCGFSRRWNCFFRTMIPRGISMFSRNYNQHHNNYYFNSLLSSLLCSVYFIRGLNNNITYGYGTTGTHTHTQIVFSYQCQHRRHLSILRVRMLTLIWPRDSCARCTLTRRFGFGNKCTIYFTSMHRFFF